MCLVLVATSAEINRAQLEAAAAEAASTGFRVVVDHPSRWPWRRATRVRATISEEGGCACSLLSDAADWNAETWAMRPEVLDRLANALEILCTRGPRELFVEALWTGDVVRETVQLTPKEISVLARSSKLGTHTKYAIVRDEFG